MRDAQIVRLWVILLRRDILLATRGTADTLQPLLFFIMVVVMVPLSIGTDSDQLAVLAPGMIWLAALLAMMLGLDRLFRSDLRDGTLEQMVLSPCPLAVLILAKVTAHWLVTGMPLVVLAPLIGALLSQPPEVLATLTLTLLLGTPVLSLVGAIGVAITIGLKRNNGLLSLLVLPLYMPTLIFGAGASSAAVAKLPVAVPLYMLAASLVLALTLAPIASAAALRIGID